MVAIAGILVVAGVVMAWAGWRGMRVGHDPHCAACDFNLKNLAEDSQRCPECGAFIRVGDSVRLGKKRAVKGLVAAGLVLVVIGGVLGIQQTSRSWAGAAKWKTVGWLQSDLASSDDVTMRRAAEELARRIRSGAMRDEQFDTLMTWVLARQADASMPWRPEWGDLVQAGHAKGRLGAAQWVTYLEGMPQLKVRVRPKVRVGDPVPVEVVCTLRAGRNTAGVAPGWAGVGARIVAAGQTAELGTSWSPVELVPIPMTFSKIWLPGEGNGWPAALARPGVQTMAVEVEGTIKDRDGLKGTVTRRVEAAVEVLPREGMSVGLGTVREGMEGEMEAAVKLRGAGEVKAAPGAAVGTLWIAGPPMAGAFRVELRQGGKAWVLARVLVRMDGAVNEALRLPVGRGVPSPGPAEVVLVPEPEGAVGTVEVMEVWPREVKREVRVAE
jgi:hypothetical protein